MSINSTNPSTLFGGTWVAWGSGRVPVGINTSDGNFNTVEKTGGSSNHTLTTTEMPSHNHTFTGTTGLTGIENQAHSHNININAVGDHAHTTLIDTSRIMQTSNTGNYSSSFHVAESGTYPTGAGGAHTHTANASAETANHNHYFTPSGTIGNAGSGNAHNNLQPYITCYMWKRTA